MLFVVCDYELKNHKSVANLKSLEEALVMVGANSSTSLTAALQPWLKQDCRCRSLLLQLP